MPSALAKVQQQVFAGGFWRCAPRHLIDERAVYDLQNFLLDSDGALYRRGGSVYKSNAKFGTGALTFLWDGYLQSGQVTVLATAGKIGVLGLDDATPVELASEGVPVSARGSVVGGMLFIDGGLIYAGSRKGASYSNSITFTNGSATVSGTGFTANVDAGMLVLIEERYYVVKEVASNTSLVLTVPFEGTTATATRLFVAVGKAGAGTKYPASEIYAVVADRLVSCEGRKVTFSKGRDVNGRVQPHSYNAYDYHEISAGSLVLGAMPSGNSLLVFATTGMWAISNMALEITDFQGNPQHQVALASKEIVLWSKEGITVWDQQLIVPCLSGVFEVNGVAQGLDIAFTIRELWRQYARQGFRIGQAITYQNHYFAPVLNGTAVVAMLVCRLDRPLRGPRGIGQRRAYEYPWTRLAGHGGSGLVLAARVGSATRQPFLWLGGLDGRVSDCSQFFEPSALVKKDADGTVQEVLVELRDMPTNAKRLNLNHVRRMRLRYRLVAAEGDHPVVTLWFSGGSEVAVGTTTWGGFKWGEASWSEMGANTFEQIATGAPPNDGTVPKVWLFKKRARFVRARLRSSDPAASLVISSIEASLRESGRDR
jgi:hypothetical protein